MSRCRARDAEHNCAATCRTIPHSFKRVCRPSSSGPAVRYHNVSLRPLRRTLLAFECSSVSVFFGIYPNLFVNDNLSCKNKLG